MSNYACFILGQYSWIIAVVLVCLVLLYAIFKPATFKLYSKINFLVILIGIFLVYILIDQLAFTFGPSYFKSHYLYNNALWNFCILNYYNTSFL